MKVVKMPLIGVSIVLLSWYVFASFAYSAGDSDSKMSDIEQVYKEQHDELTEKICTLTARQLEETKDLLDYNIKYDNPNRPKSRATVDMEKSLDNTKEELSKAQTSRKESTTTA